MQDLKDVKKYVSMVFQHKLHCVCLKFYIIFDLVYLLLCKKISSGTITSNAHFGNNMKRCRKF